MQRFLERKDLKELINQSSDFTKRRYGSLVKWGVCIAMLLLFVFSLYINSEIYKIVSQVESIPSNQVLVTIMFMSTVSVVVIFFLLVALNNFRFAIRALEFQSTLFSSAMKVSSVFCIIANNKNKILYQDRGAENIFPNNQTNSLSEILENDGISVDYKEKAKDAVATGKACEFSMTYQDAQKQQKAVLVTITTLEKPSGCFLIRGV